MKILTVAFMLLFSVLDMERILDVIAYAEPNLDTVVNTDMFPGAVVKIGATVKTKWIVNTVVNTDLFLIQLQILL